MRSPVLLLFLFGVAVVGGTPACAMPAARTPSMSRVALPGAFADAFRVDATGDPHDAIRAHLDVVRAAAVADGDPWQLAALEASLDALATTTMPALGDAAPDAALANRTAEREAIARELALAARDARGPFGRALIARALVSMAQHRGDAQAAATQRAASGCAEEALVIGPTTWAPVTGVETPGPIDRADARIEAAYATGSAFGTDAHPTVVRGRGCSLDLSAESARPGVREVVVDVDVPSPQRVGLVLRAHGAAVLRAGATEIIRRSFELGDGDAARFATVVATAGSLRVVARVGTAKEDDSVEIDVLGEDGAPLHTRAPAVGSTSSARVREVAAMSLPTPRTDDEVLLAAASAIACGNPRDAERILWDAATRSAARPDLALVYARAVETARDLSAATRAERARSAYERVLETWPTSWEATIAHAVLAGVRRGRSEAGVEILADLDARRARSRAGPVPRWLVLWVDAFDALVSGREHLFDRAHAALQRIRGAGAGALATDAEDAATPRVGVELVASACDMSSAAAHDTLACFDALRSMGDRAGEARELARIRALLGAPDALRPLELREALAAGDDAAARRALEAMLPGERTMAAASMLLSAGDDARAVLLRIAGGSRDAPGSIGPLLRAAGDDPTGTLDADAERIAAQDRVQPILPSAATAVLAHRERYDVSKEGLVHWLLFDVRRVSGTTDVEENAQAAAPDVWGRSATRALRRRIFKKDGRVLEPDRTPRASQAHADLSQLEQGDVIEAIYEGWSLPGDTGDVGIDTPDLLPGRTAVHEATIELALPATLQGSLWSHPLLGKAAERTEGSQRVLTWGVVDRPSRRVEDGVPKMDRNVSVSFSTAQWRDVGRALRETIAALDEHDPETSLWAQKAAGLGRDPEHPRRATVDAIVAATGRALRESDAGTLSDYGGTIAPVQAQTARTSLASHGGSRSWLVLRGLRELQVPCDLVVAENDPYSADPAFPPHFGRFVHPLVVAHLAAGPDGPGGDVWIDADVAGPPLPAGRISPELRGRLALRTDGTIVPMPSLGSGEDERDEVDVRLALDAQGNARGTFAIVLRGRDAQELAEALLRIVGAERQRALREVVLAWLPWANVDDVQLASSEGSWQVSLRADVSVRGYAQPEGSGGSWLLPGMDSLHWVSPRARASSLAATFAVRAGRESALAVSRAVQYHVHRRVELPKGGGVARMPGPLSIRTKLIDASRKIEVTTGGAGGTGSSAVEDDFVLGVTTGTVPATDYEAFAASTHAADDGFLASMRVTLH
ncbi:MAG: hypothetical protein ACLP1X_24320 [Polyangiaceae bacterium]